MNLKNSDIRTQTLPTQDSAPALKQILRKDAACSHLCVKCVCIVCVCSVFARLCVKCVWPYVCVFSMSQCVWRYGGTNMSVHVATAMCPSTCVCPLVCEVCVPICVGRSVCTDMYVHVGCGILTCGGV